MPFENRINPRKVGLFLAICSLYLAVQSLFGEYLLENVLSGEIDSIVTLFIDLFSVNLEESIPTWYSTLLLFSSAVLLAFIAAIKRKHKEPYAAHWIGLSILFLYLSMDEGAAIHEIFVDPLQAAFNTTGYLAFAWQIVFVPLVVIFALLYLKFLFHLPTRIRNLLILAGVLFVGGAVVVEAISANRWYLDGGVSFPYLAIATVEELCEMLGVVVFIFALLLYADENQYTAVTHFSLNTHANHQAKRWVLSLLIIAVVGGNGALGFWAYRQESTIAINDTASTLFYEEIGKQYSGQGVIILQINEAITADNMAAQPYASSLLTLFDDVLIVTFPQEQSSIAFVSHHLPFDQEIVSQILYQSGDEQFIILDIAAVRLIAEN